jgi:hypothetical protein
VSHLGGRVTLHITAHPGAALGNAAAHSPGRGCLG